MVDERDNEPDPLVKEYSRLAVDYDRRWSFYTEATTRETLDRMTPMDTGTVLDVGCGTGVLLHKLANRFPQLELTGVDPVPQMLEQARQRVTEATTLARAWAESLPFHDAAFDRVVSCNMFHYIRDPVTALSEMTRVLRPGGELVITDWCDDYLACRLCDWWLRRFSAAHVKVYRAREFKKLLADAGLPDAEINRFRISWLWGMMTARVERPG